MAHFDEPGAWSRYNATQVGRPPRALARTLLQHAGDGDGRLALDLGFGAGVETALLLDRGWRVLAVDADPAAGDSLRARLPAEQATRLTVRTRAFADLDDLPAVQLVHAAWSLPYAGVHLHRVWDAVLAALTPGGWLACDLFGERDTTSDARDVAVLADAEVERLLARLDVVHREEQEADGTSFDGPQHWHVHSVVGRRRPD
ncbi:SAM-dependent methyltransferase [Modestobacter italicus]|uniref:SAM-dependent methyltransferase n=1 Tax=Modestobacter italicus (strain DSM 44449 / CECT 9708 / BC 501) TaxID=2732864 RepID=I4EQS5_MODI5|nr:SAM-dependent methyltransferase [Modestobacter marinus]